LIDGLTTTLSLVADQAYLIRIVAKNNEGFSLPTQSVNGFASSVPSALVLPTVLSRRIDGI